MRFFSFYLKPSFHVFMKALSVFLLFLHLLDQPVCFPALCHGSRQCLSPPAAHREELLRARLCADGTDDTRSQIADVM